MSALAMGAGMLACAVPVLTPCALYSRRVSRDLAAAAPDPSPQARDPWENVRKRS